MTYRPDGRSWTLFESARFIVETPVRPHIDRADGGHVVIRPRRTIEDRRFLTPTEAVELTWLSMLVAEAMFEQLPKHAIDLGRINFQDNGNWGLLRHGRADLHLHLYGRARSSRFQAYGQALFFPPPDDPMYDRLEPFTDEEMASLRSAISDTAKGQRYAMRDSWVLGDAEP